MKVNSLLNIALLISLLVLESCDKDDNELIKTRTSLLTDVQWTNSQIIGTAPSGYSIYLPVIFKQDKSVYIAGTKLQWAFIDNGNSIKIAYPNSFKTWSIVSLTETEFHFKEFDNKGQFIIELIYTQ
jgi:hypothetical protein